MELTPEKIDNNIITNVLYPNITMILHGIICDKIDTNKLITYYKTICPLVVSIYSHDIPKLHELCNNDILENVIIVEQDYQKYKKDSNKRGFKRLNTNAFYNFSSSIKALQYVKTDYVIKNRIDHYYSNLEQFINHAIDSNKLICSSSLYVRGIYDKHHKFRYHLSDCLFMMKTIDMKHLFNTAYIKFQVGCPEVALWKPYLLYICNKDGFNLESTSDEKYIEILTKYITVFDINYLKPFYLKLQNNVHENLVTVCKSTADILRNGCM
jgi:hypothetical protein